MILVGAGAETTTSLIGNAIGLLADRPSVQDELRSRTGQGGDLHRGGAPIRVSVPLPPSHRGPFGRAGRRRDTRGGARHVALELGESRRRRLRRSRRDRPRASQRPLARRLRPRHSPLCRRTVGQARSARGAHEAARAHERGSRSTRTNRSDGPTASGSAATNGSRSSSSPAEGSPTHLSALSSHRMQPVAATRQSGHHAWVGGDRSARVPALFLTGAPGSGKTAVAHEISELLWQIGEPHAVIDVDELARGVLPTGSDDFNLALAATNLAAVWENFRAVGVRRLVLARIVQGPEELQRLCDALPDCDITVCRVTATRQEIRERIARREAGSAREFLLNVSERVNGALDGAGLPGFVVENNASSQLTRVAQQILDRLGWPYQGSTTTPGHSCRSGATAPRSRRPVEKCGSAEPSGRDRRASTCRAVRLTFCRGDVSGVRHGPGVRCHRAVASILVAFNVLRGY